MGRMASVSLLTLLAINSASAQDITPTYPTLNVEQVYPAIVCETEEAVMDIKDWSEQSYNNQITLTELKEKMKVYIPICDSDFHALTLKKEIDRYVGITAGGDDMIFGVFETNNPTKFAITAIGTPGQKI